EAEEAKTPKMVRRGDGQRRGGVVERGEVVDLRRRETMVEAPRRESVANLRQREDVARREETPKIRERRTETRRNNSSGSRDAQMRRGDEDNPYESESEKDRNKKKGIREFLGRRKVVAATIAALAVGGLTGAMAARGINVVMQEGEKMERIYDSGEEETDAGLFPNALGEEKRKAREMLPGEMVQLDLEQVYASGRYNDEVGSVQGFAVTDKYMVVVNVARGASGDGWVTAMDLDNPWGGYAWESGRLHDIFHGNGATWNSGANEIAIINDEKEIFLDAESGEYMRDNDMEGEDYTGGGIAHNANGGYITMKGNKIKTPKGEFNVDIPLVFQDIAYNDGYIYVSAWANAEYLVNDGRIEDAEICRNNFEEGSNAIYKYTEDGEFVDAYFIPAGAGEIESLAFGSDGAPYLLFNEAGNYSIQRAANMN
ncbi:MAG: hypothetical protein Q4F60_02685, partial [Candidatus Saccharibacteria bacterium]|nr:hypothetical protein [Candidatus Saccharibacteria bacterium]